MSGTDPFGAKTTLETNSEPVAVYRLGALTDAGIPHRIEAGGGVSTSFGKTLEIKHKWTFEI